MKLRVARKVIYENEGNFRRYRGSTRARANARYIRPVIYVADVPPRDRWAKAYWKHRCADCDPEKLKKFGRDLYCKRRWTILTMGPEELDEDFRNASR